MKIAFPVTNFIPLSDIPNSKFTEIPSQIFFWRETYVGYKFKLQIFPVVPNANTNNYSPCFSLPTPSLVASRLMFVRRAKRGNLLDLASKTSTETTQD